MLMLYGDLNLIDKHVHSFRVNEEVYGRGVHRSAVVFYVFLRRRLTQDICNLCC